jgi:hypothetical protein
LSFSRSRTYRSLDVFRGSLRGADRRNSVPRSPTNVSHAAHFRPRTLLKIRHARRRSCSRTIVRPRSSHQLLDRKLLDSARPADLCIALEILYAYWREKSGSLLAPIIGHNASDGVEYVLILCARSIKRFEGGRWRLRRMREGVALWEFYQLPNAY